MGWVNALGGPVAAVIAILLAVNVMLSALGAALSYLHVNAPGWIGKVCGYAKVVSDWLAANVQHK